MPGEIASNIKDIRARMAAACASCKRDPAEVTLVGVGKTQPAEALLEAHAAGLRDFGENYVQEWRDKAQALASECPDLRWHLVGHLQRNKVKYLAGRVACIHSVDNLDLLQEIAKRWAALGATCEVLFEVNLGGEESKSGCTEENVRDLASAALGLAGVRPVGLMTLPPLLPPEQVRPYFTRLRRLRDRLRVEVPALGEAFRHLSMGMSGDFEVAIQEGATLIRVGTRLFGARSYPQPPVQ